MSDKSFPNKLADGDLSGGYESDMTASKVLEEGHGYELLGLFDEARFDYESIPRDSEYRNIADLRLVMTDISQEKMNDAAQRGLALLPKNPRAKLLIFETALALHHAGRTREAYNLIMSHPDMFGQDGNDAYAIASYAAPIGEVGFALSALFYSYRYDKRYWIKSLFDMDIEPVWTMGAEQVLAIDSAIIFAHPLMAQVLDAAAARTDEMPADYEMLFRVPIAVREHLKVNPVTGLYWLDGKASRDVRQDYLKWQRDRKTQMVFLARQAVRRAREVVLDHQLEWAVQRAKRGNLIAARHHVLFAMGERPTELLTFEEQLRPLGLGYLFDELVYAERIDPEFSAKRARIELLTNSDDLAGARDALDSLHPNLQSLTLSLIREAEIENRRGNRRYSLEQWKRISRRWPNDAVGFANAIDLLIKEAKWDEARNMNLAAPESYHLIKLGVQQTSDLAEEKASGKKWEAEDFYGQPDWDERLKIADAIEQLQHEDK